ncbi:39S ribosomal protein L48, mitochondrial [Rhinatrema bivittatum]|uniref:39S ribosomal protein L48, mitochondrial n=1 Tax=Rhinatrema bivittatum TaxID=194408 RepID=UPI00112DCA2C|nr:39S ribosomal protein L48, mitochondrial [Rhinatrema bivittatum]
MLRLWSETILNQAVALARLSAIRRPPFCSAGGILLSSKRQHRSKPTHGIGRFRHLLPEEPVKKRKEQLPERQVKAGTDHEYGTLNMCVSGYDMTLVEHYMQYIHNLCSRLAVKVEESYAMPTKTHEILLLQEKGTKMYVDAVLTTHERIIQVSGMSSTLAPVVLEVLQINQPEGVHLSVREHTEADFQTRLKARPELQELMAQMS